jgi:hypothetical protein
MNIHELLASSGLLKPRQATVDGLGVVYFRRRNLRDQVKQDADIERWRDAKKAGDSEQTAARLLEIVLSDLCDADGVATCDTPELQDQLAEKLPATVANDLIQAWIGKETEDAKN